MGEINGDTTEILSAIEVGYRHFDTAIAYRNEAVVGKAIKESGLPREAFFITSKIPGKPEYTSSERSVMEAVEFSLANLGTEYLDLYLMDIKHTNPAKHKEFTGRPNDLMMENARKVALSGKCKLIIRVPVIPTFNDTIEEIQGIARFADTLPGVEQLHLLPYHRLGQDKYIGLGRPYLMEGILPPTKEHMETLKKAAESVSSLHVQIGG